MAVGLGAVAPRRAESSTLSEVVRAAGGVVTRGAGDDLEVLVVHRPRYEDWSFPKGKAEPGESDEECARREVEEETGLVCQLEEELSSTSYVDGAGRPKRVRYWRMHPVGGSLRFEHEVDAARWLALAPASELLTYDRDRALLVGLG